MLQKPIHCLVCDGVKVRFLLEKKSEGASDAPPLKLLQCKTCEIVFLENWDEAFQESYYEYYANRLGLSKDKLYDPVTALRYEDLLLKLWAKAPGKKILDVGCGQGHFIEVAQRLGWNCLGIDRSDSAIQVAKQFDLPVKNLDFFSEELSSETFDVITMFELIEHVPYPQKFIERAFSLLKPGGVLYLTTPNYDCADRKVLGHEWTPIHREHLLYFSATSLKRFFEENSDFKCESIETKNISSSALKKFFQARSTTKSSAVDQFAEEKFRNDIEKSRLLKTGKALLNLCLNQFDAGSSLSALYVKPENENDRLKSPLT